jgi:hypothetical protein
MSLLAAWIKILFFPSKLRAHRRNALDVLCSLVWSRKKGLSKVKLRLQAADTVFWYPCNFGQYASNLKPVNLRTASFPTMSKGQWSETLEERAWRKTDGIIKSHPTE